MSKICLHIQSLSTVDTEMLASSIHWAFWIGRHTMHEILLSTPNRSSIDRGRNEAARIAMEAECDYLWFLDDDMPIPPHTLQALIDCNADIAMAHSYVRGYPYDPMCFYWNEGSGPHNPQGSTLRFATDEELELEGYSTNGIVKVAAVGFTCTLIKVDLLKRLFPPFFLTTANSTEDVYFCLKAHFEQSEPLRVVVDTNIHTVHLGSKERISKETVKGLRKYHKPFQPKEEEKDRGEDYLKMVQQLEGEPQ